MAPKGIAKALNNSQFSNGGNQRHHGSGDQSKLQAHTKLSAPGRDSGCTLTPNLKTPYNQASNKNPFAEAGHTNTQDSITASSAQQSSPTDPSLTDYYLLNTGDWASTTADQIVGPYPPPLCPYHLSMLQSFTQAPTHPQDSDWVQRFLSEDLHASYIKCSSCADLRNDTNLYNL